MLNYEFPPLGGGAAPVTEALASHLVAGGHEVDVVTMSYRGLPGFEERAGLRIFRVPTWRRSSVMCSTPEMMTYIIPAMYQSVHLHRQQPYDIIHAHFIIPTSPVGALMRWLCHIPMVITIHGSDVPGYNPDRFKLGHRLLQPVWRWLTRQADAIISPSHYLGDMLRTTSLVPVTIIPYGYEQSALVPIPKRRQILCATRLFPRKGVQYLLQALEGIDLDGWEVVIAGDGPCRETLETEAAKLNLPVRFVGFVKGQTLETLYAESSVFVFPSVRENFPVVLLEAMNAGCGVIASDISGMPEVVGSAGLLIPPADIPALRAAICLLMADRALLDQLSTAARKRVTLFDWTAIIAQHERTYLQAHERRARSLQRFSRHRAGDSFDLPQEQHSDGLVDR
ncbi:MAG: glycosyltransferase [Herpetosiphon sp.]